jgi:hypothetical protein
MKGHAERRKGSGSCTKKAFLGRRSREVHTYIIRKRKVSHGADVSMLQAAIKIPFEMTVLIKVKISYALDCLGRVNVAS